MSKIVKITVRLDSDLNDAVQFKCKERFGICVSTFIKIFLKSFVSRKGIGFYMGDEDLHQLFQRWLEKQENIKDLGRNAALGKIGPNLKDVYNF